MSENQKLITSFVKKNEKRKKADTSIDGMEEEDQQDEGAKRHNELLLILKGIQGTVTGLTSKFDALETKVTNLSTKYEEQKAQVENLLKRNTELQQENAEIKGEMGKMRQDLNVESFKRDQLENQDRKFCLEVSGVPQSDDEDPHKLVEKVMELAGATQRAAAIDIAHRKYAGGLIVRFHSRTDRDQVYDKRFQLKGKSSLNMDMDFVEKNDLYINESLTFDRSVLMKIVRDEVKVYNQGKPKEQKLKVKTVGGYIKVTDKRGKYQRINSKDDLLAIIRM